MGGGGHKPGEVFSVRCIAKSGPKVSFLSNDVSISAIFHQQEDADYFDVKREYVVDFMPVTGSHPAGQRGSEPQSGS